MAYGNYAPFYRGGYFNPMQPQGMQNMMENQYAPPQPIQNVPQQQAPIPQPFTQPTQSNNDIIWVQGEAGAKAYLVAPNTTVTLWDSESPTIYIKTADMNGIPSMRILDFTERSTNAPKTPTEHVCACGNKFVKIDDFEPYRTKIEELEGIVEKLQANIVTKSTKTTKAVKGDSNNE